MYRGQLLWLFVLVVLCSSLHTYNIISYVVVFVQTRSALMLFFLTCISSGTSQEKLQAYRGPHGIILYIILYCCTRWTYIPRGHLTQRGRVYMCVQKHIIENPSTQSDKASQVLFARTKDICYIIYGQAWWKRTNTRHGEERAQRLAILEGSGQRQQHYMYI